MGFNAVIISKVTPSAQSSHGGGRVLAEHCRSLLSIGAKVTIVAPREPRNEEVDLGDLNVEVELYEPSSAPESRYALLLRGLRSVLWPGEMTRHAANQIASVASIRAALSAADYIECSWVESAGALSTLRDLRNGAPTAIYCHDVLPQRYEREWRSERGALLRLARWFRWKRSLARQREVLGRADLLWVLSEKDRGLVVAGGVTTACEVLPPPVDPGRGSLPELGRSSTSATVLFVGAMGRAENVEGLNWFAEACWPGILRSVPTAELHIAGSGSLELEAALSAIPNCRVLGYVPDLAELYAEASVAVIPLLRGAGVKIKTVEALCANVPVVGTSVGMEGIPHPKIDQCTADTASAFVDKVTERLRLPEMAREQSEELSEWAQTFFGRENYERTLTRGLMAIGVRGVEPGLTGA